MAVKLKPRGFVDLLTRRYIDADLVQEYPLLHRHQTLSADLMTAVKRICGGRGFD